jgi:hypothetical protein
MHCAYRLQLRPSRSQARNLERMAHARRFAYNWGLERWREFHELHGRTIPLRLLLRDGLRRPRTWPRAGVSGSTELTGYEHGAPSARVFEALVRVALSLGEFTPLWGGKLAQRLREWAGARETREGSGGSVTAVFRRRATSGNLGVRALCTRMRGQLHGPLPRWRLRRGPGDPLQIRLVREATVRRRPLLSLQSPLLAVRSR